MKKLLLSILMLTSYLTYGQNYNIGHKQITFTDVSRNNRSIQTEIYYPANTAGDDVTIASGQFPILIFGHGFVMAWDSYQWLWDSIVPMGYIMAFPRTEGSISPSHSDFGLDLKFLNEQFKTENITSSSFFFQHVAPTSAIMGHSMGGGASFLAAENYTNFTTLINFAAATTNPSSITAAANVTVPLLMFIGENDGVAPPTDHQFPMYDSCLSDCKTKVIINGGGHCYFADYNFNCSFGETTTSPQPTISREEQHIVVMNLLKPYLNYMLKGNSSDGLVFISNLQNNPNITYERDCNTYTNENIFKDFIIYPNPVKDFINILIPKNTTNTNIILKDILGNTLYSANTTSSEIKITIDKNFKNGIYILTLSNSYGYINYKVIKTSF